MCCRESLEVSLAVASDTRWCPELAELVHLPWKKAFAQLPCFSPHSRVARHRHGFQADEAHTTFVSP